MTIITTYVDCTIIDFTVKKELVYTGNFTQQQKVLFDSAVKLWEHSGFLYGQDATGRTLFEEHFCYYSDTDLNEVQETAGENGPATHTRDYLPADRQQPHIYISQPYLK